jgi:NitT/TauT family transport system permease protein
VRVFSVPVIIVPPPSLVVTALWLGLSDGTILRNLYYTLLETVSGYGLAVLTGVGFGSLISQVRWVDRAIYPYIIGFQSVPKMALAPLLVLWFGFGLTSKILVAGMVAFFPILVNTIEGLHNTDPGRILMLRSFGATEWQVFRMIKQPSALPFIFAGLDTGIVLSLLGAVVGEFVGAQVGLGNLIMMANYKMDIAAMFAALLVLSIVGVSLHLLLVVVQRRVVFWAGKSAPTSA